MLKLNLSLMLLILSSAISLGQQTKFDMGCGKISINQYVFAPGVKPLEFALDRSGQPPATQYTYFIKKNKILRKDFGDQPAQTVKKTNPVTSDSVANFTAELVHPEYILDLDKNTAHAYSASKSFITLKSIEELTVDGFYRLFISGTDLPYHSADTVSAVIANKNCYRGTAKIGKQQLIFYYTKDKMGVVSPLNGYISKKFKYNVMSVLMEVNWTLPGGIPGTGNLIFQIASIDEGGIRDDVFHIPSGIRIKKRISLAELYTN